MREAAVASRVVLPFGLRRRVLLRRRNALTEVLAKVFARDARVRRKETCDGWFSLGSRPLPLS